MTPTMSSRALAAATIIVANAMCVAVAGAAGVAQQMPPGAASHGVLDVQHLSADGMHATFTNANSHVQSGVGLPRWQCA